MSESRIVSPGGFVNNGGSAFFGHQQFNAQNIIIGAASQANTSFQPESSSHPAVKIIEKLNVYIPFRLPFPRNRAFVGRSEELRKIHQCFNGLQTTDKISQLEVIDSYFTESTSTVHEITPKICALTGTGGMGKTQIATEYAYQYHSTFNAVFWIFAGSEDAIRASFINTIQCIVREQARITWPNSVPNYEAIGLKLEIPGLIDTRGKVSDKIEIFGDIHLALFHWLELTYNKWLLIFDNADDLESFDLQKYLPKNGNGAILITSRRPEFSHSAEQLNLDELDKESSVSLLLNLAQLTSSVEENQIQAAELVKTLGYLPLAITHAGYFIYESKVSLDDYLSYYNCTWMAIQSKKPKFGWSYQGTAATTWEISFTRIQEKDKEAALFLSVCSYFDPQEISESLWEDKKADTDLQLVVKNWVLLLASYSLVRIIRYGVFSIHPVVHKWARERMQQSERLQILENALLVVSSAAYNKSQVSNRRIYWMREDRSKIMPHMEHLHREFNPNCLEIIIQRKVEASERNGIDEQTVEKILRAIRYIGKMFVERGKYNEAMYWNKQALALCQPWDIRYSGDARALASTLYRQANYDEALQWYKRALANLQNYKGNERGRVSIIRRIADIFWSQGKFDEALIMYQDVLTGYQSVGAERSFSVLKATIKIGEALHHQGKYDEATPFFENARAGFMNLLAQYENVPAVVDIMHYIGKAFHYQNNDDEAIRWFHKALDRSVEHSGQDHPTTIWLKRYLTKIIKEHSLTLSI